MAKAKANEVEQEVEVENKAAVAAEVQSSVVLVRCVSDLKPWASGKPMDMGKDYEVTNEEALKLSESGFVVSLKGV